MSQVKYFHKVWAKYRLLKAFIDFFFQQHLNKQNYLLQWTDDETPLMV